MSCLCYVDVILGCLVAVFCHFDMICMLFDVIMSVMCDVTFRRFVALFYFLLYLQPRIAARIREGSSWLFDKFLLYLQPRVAGVRPG